MIKNSLLLICCVFLIVACGNETTSSDSTTAQETDKAETPIEKKEMQFGEAITANGAISLDEMLQKMGDSDSLAIKVRGTVESVCQVKGCWMNIVPENAENESMFVQFKDYGFFMPLDCTGKTVVMDGYAYRDVTSVDDLKHFAEDEGKSQEEIDAITEPVEELKYLAHGVVLVE